MGGQLFIISHSKVQSFFRCRKQYWWEYLSDEPKPAEVQTVAGIVGKGVHRAMKVLCQTGNPQDGANELDSYLRMPDHAPAGPGTEDHARAFRLFDAGCAAHKSIVSQERWAEHDASVPSEKLGISVRARLDRADRLSLEHYQLIDWKTGRFDIDEVVDEQLDIGHLAVRTTFFLSPTARVTAVAWNLASGTRRVRELERRDAAATMHRYAGIAARMQATTTFEPTPNPGCSFCRRRSRCPEGSGPPPDDWDVEPESQG